MSSTEELRTALAGCHSQCVPVLVLSLQLVDQKPQPQPQPPQQPQPQPQPQPLPQSQPQSQPPQPTPVKVANVPTSAPAATVEVHGLPIEILQCLLPAEQSVDAIKQNASVEAACINLQNSVANAVHQTPGFKTQIATG